MSELQELTFPFKYEPTSLNDMIVSDDTRASLKEVIEKMPNIILCGRPGVGKGTFVNILLKETGYDFLKINASKETSVDMVRTKVEGFATALGFTKYKIVYLNEADWLSINAQKSLLQLMEDVHSHTRFIFTCNYFHKLLEELVSRCQVFNLNSPPAKEIYSHCIKILEKENIEIVNEKPFKKSLVETIRKLYPDIRRTLNSLERSIVNGKIEIVESKGAEEVYSEILKFAKEQDLEEIRKLLRSNPVDYVSLYNYLYENLEVFNSPGDAVLEIGEYLYRDGFVAIKEVNFMTMIVKMIKNGII